MTYFCAKCQRRHDVSHISADMFSICREKIRNGIREVTDRLRDEIDSSILSDLSDELISFVNIDNDSSEGMVQVEGPAFCGDARINAFFALDRDTMLHSQGSTRDGLTVTCDYKVTLMKIYNLYKQYAPSKDEDFLESFKPYETESWMREEVCKVKVVGLFDKNGVLDKVTDQYNTPFAQNGEMLGFNRICPYCGRELSRATGCGQEIVVALAGSPRAGKTSCMVAMASSLASGTTSYIDLLPLVQDKKWKDLCQEIERYRKCLKITKTPNTQKEVPSMSVLIQLDDLKKTRRVLTIVDMPGEFWQSGDGLTADFFNQYAGLYENIDCIWFVISKATVRMSQSEVPEEVLQGLLEKTSEDQTHIRGANPENLRMNLGALKAHLTSRGKPMPPTLVIVSKPDYYVSDVDREDTAKYGLMPKGDVTNANDKELNILLRPTSKSTGLDEYRLWCHSYAVRKFLQESNHRLLKAIEDNCADRFYISLSPYGRPAGEEFDFDDGYHPSPTPYHELLPLLWTLAINSGILVSHKLCITKTNWLGKIVDTEEETENILFDERQRKLPTPDGASKKDKANWERQQKITNDLCNNLLMNTEKFIKTSI